MHMKWNVVLSIKVIELIVNIYFIFEQSDFITDIVYVAKSWTNEKQSRISFDLTCWVFNCHFPQSRNFVIRQMLLPVITQERFGYHVIYLMADNAPLTIFLFCVTSHMLMRSTAAEDVVCSGCHESFRKLLSNINQSTLCWNFHCTIAVELVADSGTCRSQRS